MRAPTQSDSIKIQQRVIVFLLIVASVLLGKYAVQYNNPFIGFLIPGIALCSWLFGRPEILLLMLLFAASARLIIPGLPATLGVSQILQVLAIGWMVLDASLRKKPHLKQSNSQHSIWIGLFIINLLLIMAVRGAGFAMLGGSVFGGTTYLVLFISLAVYFAVVRIDFPSRHIKTLILLILIGTLTQAIAELLIYFYGTSLSFLTKFMQIKTEGFLDLAQVEGEFVRWTSFRWLAVALLPVAFVLNRSKSVRILMIMLAFVLVGLTGFRSVIAQILIMTFACSLYFSKQRRKVFLYWIFIGIAGLAILIPLTSALPPAIQRAISFIPFIPVGPDIAFQTQGSTDFRVDMWRDYCIPNVAEYLLIGRGVASDITSFAWLQASWYGSAEFFYHMHGYHSGPFSLLLDFGLFGTIVFLSFFILTIVDACRTLRRYARGRDDILSRYYGFLAILMSYQLFHFIFIFGDVPSNMFNMMMTAAQLQILKKNFLSQPVVAADISPATQQQPVSWRNAPQRTMAIDPPVNRWARPVKARR
jgi:hypothetical protein